MASGSEIGERDDPITDPIESEEEDQSPDRGLDEVFQTVLRLEVHMSPWIVVLRTRAITWAYETRNSLRHFFMSPVNLLVREVH